MIKPHTLLGKLLENKLNQAEVKDYGLYWYGNVNEIKEVMNLYSKEGKSLYPLIWMELPFTNPRLIENSSKLEVDLKLFLATNSKKSWLNDKRNDETFEKVLEPLFEKLEKVLVKSQTFKVIDDAFNLNWLPNFYTAELGTRENPSKNQVLEYWDVLTVQFKAKVYRNYCDVK